jgi:hypothetical protein
MAATWGKYGNIRIHIDASILATGLHTSYPILRQNLRIFVCFFAVCPAVDIFCFYFPGTSAGN